MKSALKSRYKETVKRISAMADVRINGRRPWDIKVHDDRFYQRVLGEGSIGFGESYMEGMWDCQDLDELLYRLQKAELDKKIVSLRLGLLALRAKLFNLQTPRRAFDVGKKHYDRDNALFKAMLDKRMAYSCAYWKESKSLDQAQEAKLDLVCRKLNLKPGQRILDIGCGWGSFMKFAAEKYKARCVGITVSEEQVALGKALCKGLPVEFRLQDYRDLNGKFDHVVSIGMFEHVGAKNYRTYFKVAHRCLKDEGLFLLHTVSCNKPGDSPDPWIAKHIFTNSATPTAAQIASAVQGLFIIEDWHNFGHDYAKTA
jgi:cyclopropane-fatty-acyl-phospholipid synthase